MNWQSLMSTATMYDYFWNGILISYKKYGILKVSKYLLLNNIKDKFPFIIFVRHIVNGGLDKNFLHRHFVENKFKNIVCKTFTRFMSLSCLIISSTFEHNYCNKVLIIFLFKQTTIPEQSICQPELASGRFI